MPCSTASTAARPIASSRSRPTIGVSTPSSPRTVGAPSAAASTGRATTGAALPLSVSVTGSPHEKSGSASRCVSSPTRTVPGAAWDCSRAAVFTASPSALYSTRPPAPIAPTTTSPVSTPTRTPNPPTPQPRSTSAANCAMSSTIRRPARIARSASSSCATGAPNSASSPSPARSFTVPPKASTAPIIRAIASATISFRSSGSRRSPSGVEPTMSANSAVTTRRSSRMSPISSGIRASSHRATPSCIAYDSAPWPPALPAVTRTETARSSARNARRRSGLRRVPSRRSARSSPPSSAISSGSPPRRRPPTPRTSIACSRPTRRWPASRIEAYGGVVEKFIGDAVVGIFGVPAAHEDDPERAVRAALRIAEDAAELEAIGGAPLTLRIGINTGETLVRLGVVPGSGERMLAGDAINTASRIQSVAPEMGVAVGLDTYAATSQVFDYQELEAGDAQGQVRARPYLPREGAAARASATDLTRTHDSPFIGREIDLALLKGIFDKAVAADAPQLVTVVGEPGLGKSRIVAELFAHLDTQSDLITWRQGRCLPYGEGITFWALGEILKAHAGILESDPPEVGDREARPGPAGRPRAGVVPAAAPPAARDRGHLGGRARRAVHRLASVPRARRRAGPDRARLRGPALGRRRDARVPRAPGRPGRGGPAARDRDRSSRAPRTASRVRRGPRERERDQARPALGGRDRAARLRPARSPPCSRPSSSGRSSSARAAIPSTPRSSCACCKDRDLLTKTGSSWELREGAEVPFPDSVQALIAARLDTLPADTKSMLADAAVVGKVFWAGAIAQMGDRDLAEVTESLRELSRKELVRPTRRSSIEGEAEYAFWHVLARDVAYGQLPEDLPCLPPRRRGALAGVEGPRSRRGPRRRLGLPLRHRARSGRRGRGDRPRRPNSKLPRAGSSSWRVNGRSGSTPPRPSGTSSGRWPSRHRTIHSDPRSSPRFGEAAQHGGRTREAVTALEEAIALFRDRGEVVPAARGDAHALADRASSSGTRARWTLPHDALAPGRAARGGARARGSAGRGGGHPGDPGPVPGRPRRGRTRDRVRRRARPPPTGADPRVPRDRLAPTSVIPGDFRTSGMRSRSRPRRAPAARRPWRSTTSPRNSGGSKDPRPRSRSCARGSPSGGPGASRRRSSSRPRGRSSHLFGVGAFDEALAVAEEVDGAAGGGRQPPRPGGHPLRARTDLDLPRRAGAGDRGVRVARAHGSHDGESRDALRGIGGRPRSCGPRWDSDQATSSLLERVDGIRGGREKGSYAETSCPAWSARP